MTKLLIQGIIVILLWVGAWGILEIMVDYIADDNRNARLATYFVLLLLGILLLWLVEIMIQD